MKTRLWALSLGPRSPDRNGLNPHSPDYRKSGDDLRAHLIRHAGLTPESRVLDIGCGTGRLAHALRDYITTGVYHGVDLNRGHIDHCRKQFTFCKGYRFKHLDYYHQEWNPKGSREEYKLPYEPGTLDIIVMVGVLNHLDIKRAADLIHHAAPLLRSYGSLAATVRLLNHHSMAHLRQDQYPYRTHESWYADRTRPLLDIAVPEEGFRRVLIHSRLQIREPIRYGTWGSSSGPLDQDLLVAVKV